LGYLLETLSVQTTCSHADPETLRKAGHPLPPFQKRKKPAKDIKKPDKGTGSDGKHWAKGTGYGTSADDALTQNWSADNYVKEQKAQAAQTATLLQVIAAIVKSNNKDTELSPQVLSMLEASCLSTCMKSWLRNDSILDMSRYYGLYNELFNLLNTFSEYPQMWSMISGCFELLQNLVKMADVILKRLNTADTKSSDDSGDAGQDKRLAQCIRKTFTKVQRLQEESQRSDEGKTSGEATERQEVLNEKEQAYRKALKEFQFDEADMQDDNDTYTGHHYANNIEKETNASPGKMKRLVQEISSLSTSMPLYTASSVFMRVDSERMDVMKFIITGPEDTPYDSGCFIFDVYCPSTYPDTAPLVNLETTGNGTVRFNPNLYNCGKVCLSLLGTWRGGPNEKWNPSTSTLLQVLVSIQSLILVEQPYFNEPGYESSMGTPTGDAANRAYNEKIKCATIRWAMIDMLENPPKGFEDVIKVHFTLRRDYIVKTLYKWLEDDKLSKTAGHFDKLYELVQRVVLLLQKLDPDKKLDIPSFVDPKKEEELKDIKRWDLGAEIAMVIPGYPIALYHHALKTKGDNKDNAIGWLLDQGQQYMFSHTEMFAIKPPAEALLATQVFHTQN